MSSTNHGPRATSVDDLSLGVRHVDTEPLLTVEDVTRLYQISPETQRTWRYRRKLPYLTVGGHRMIRYRRRDVDGICSLVGAGENEAVDDVAIAAWALARLTEAQRAEAVERAAGGPR